MREVSVSMGLMLENISERLMAVGAPHFNAPDKLGYACRLLRKAVGSSFTGSDEISSYQFAISTNDHANLNHIAYETRGLDEYMRAAGNSPDAVTKDFVRGQATRQSGALFRATLLDWLEPLGLGAETERLTQLIDTELAG